MKESTTQATEMTLRDYFAAKAMQGMVSNNWGYKAMMEEGVAYAYEIADAMMRVRGGGQ